MNNDMPTPYYGLLYQIDRDSTAWAEKHTVPRVYLAADVERLLEMPMQTVTEERDRLRGRLAFSESYAVQMHTALLKLVANPDPEVHRVAFHALMPVGKAPLTAYEQELLERARLCQCGICEACEFAAKVKSSG